MRTGFVGLILIASLTVAVAHDHKHPQPPQNNPPPTTTTNSPPTQQPVATAPFGITILRNLRNVSLNK